MQNAHADHDERARYLRLIWGRCASYADCGRPTLQSLNNCILQKRNSWIGFFLSWQLCIVLQARSASFAKRLMPCQAEEEVNQLAYVQKHLPSLLALLAESTEDGENDTKVCNVLIKNLEFLFYLNFVLKSAAAFWFHGCVKKWGWHDHLFIHSRVVSTISYFAW